MKLSTRSRYGTRALIDIALNANGKPVLLRDVARRQEISTMYLEHLITPLISAGIVRSTRGAKGGVWLARSPKDVKLTEVIQLLEGSLAPVECVDDLNYCPRYETCVTREIWVEMKRVMNDVLGATTLEDLVERQRQRQDEDTDSCMYYI
jgi:Rrf2 family transcriptional regulator, cysteine metabolism repressor